MVSVKVAALAGFTALFATAVQAADMPRLLPPVELPAVSEDFGGWYLRGDIGYRLDKVGSVSASSSGTPVTSSRIDNVFAGGLGGGYKYQWFRADMTVDYGTQAKFHGDVPRGPSYYNMKIDTLTVLVNGYVDFGTWYGFTPYLGAGVGISYLRTGDYTVASLGNALIPTRANWSPSWAAMAGVSYQMLPNIAIDLGYRYLSIGDAKSGFEPPAYTAFTTVKNLSAQEFRVGFRFLLD